MKLLTTIRDLIIFAFIGCFILLMSFLMVIAFIGKLVIDLILDFIFWVRNGGKL